MREIFNMAGDGISIVNLTLVGIHWYQYNLLLKIYALAFTNNNLIIIDDSITD